MEALRFENVTKKFGTLLANHNVSFSIEKGKIYSILGENGSGKTTLMNVVAGIYQQDSGRIYINGVEATIKSPRDAFSYRVGMIHQHFKLVDVFTASENVLLGLTKSDYKSYHKEQVEKLKERENKYGTLKFLKNEIKHYERLIKYTFDRQPSIAQNFRNQLEELKKEYEKVSTYSKYERRARGFNIKGAAERIENISEKYGFRVDANKHVYDMSVSEKQTLEIIKVLYRGVDLLILDEPTAVLTPQETEQLFDALRNMKELGKTVIIITHKLNEVLEISDKVVVLRKGEYIGEVLTKDATEQSLTDMMVGKKVELNIKRSKPKDVCDRLFVNGLTVKNSEGNIAVDNVSFTAKGGEILGIAGISGSGQKELLEAIGGLRHPTEGTIIFQNPKKNVPVTFFHKNLKTVKELAKENAFHDSDGNAINFTGISDKEIITLVNEKKVIFNEDEIINLKDKDPLQIRELGIRLSFVPEDRLGMGLVGSMDLTDNMMLRSYRKGKGMFVNRKNPEELAKEIVDELEVATPSLHTPVRQLSGGNIQKILVGREISYTPKVLMTAYPVRGLDINSSYAIYNLLDKQKKKGTAVIYVGEDLDVLLALCDRVMIISAGKNVGIYDCEKITKEEVGLLMTKGAK